MEISEITVRDIEYALWVSRENSKLLNGDDHNITRLCRDAHRALIAEVKASNVDNPLRIGYTAREI